MLIAVYYGVVYEQFGRTALHIAAMSNYSEVRIFNTFLSWIFKKSLAHIAN